MTLGQRISQYRKNLGLSQEALGERLGVSRQAVSKWETGAAAPDMENLLALARVFGVSVAELTKTPEKPSAPESSPSLPASGHLPSLRLFWPVTCAMLAVLLAGTLVLTLFMNRPFSSPSEIPMENLPAESPSSEQTVSAPQTDFALLWYGTDGHEEFLELGEQTTLFPFETTLELTEPPESSDTDFSVMTSHMADCGAITVGYYHIEEEDSPERESIWRLSTIVSTVRTPRGIHPGSTKAQVLEAYGDALVYCLKGDSPYTIAPYDYYYAYQTPETGGAAMLLYMKDGLVSAVQMEHMAEWGSEAYPPDHIHRFPLVNGEPDFSLRAELEGENISDTRKVYIAWNQLVTNNNLSAEERYTYRQTIFGLLPLMDWQELSSYGSGGNHAESHESATAVEAFMSWLHDQTPYTDAAVFQIQLGCMAKGLDGAYTDMYCHLLSTALFANPIGFVKGLAADSVEETMGHVLRFTAYDAELYPTDTEIVLDTLLDAERAGLFKKTELGWSKLLRLYLSAPMEDRVDLPRTPAEPESLSTGNPDWWNEAWDAESSE